MAPFLGEERLGKVRVHLHALLCQFSTTLEAFGIGFVENLEMQPAPSLVFRLRDPTGKSQKYSLAFDSDCDVAEIALDCPDAPDTWTPFCQQRIEQGKVLQLLGGDTVTADALEF